jgi:hypothetical protein
MTTNDGPSARGGVRRGAIEPWLTGWSTYVWIATWLRVLGHNHIQPHPAHTVSSRVPVDRSRALLATHCAKRG